MRLNFYLSKNKSRENEIKFGIFFNNRFDRILDSKDQFSYPSEYINIWDLEITDKYKLKLKILDKIISIISRYSINELENLYNKKFINLRKISSHLMPLNNGGTELIKLSGIEIIKLCILVDFPLLGINVNEYKQDEVDKINQNNKKKSKYKNEKILKKYKNLSNNFIEYYKLKFKPNEYQNDILLNKLENFLKIKKGTILWACGLGKTYLSLFICHHINAKNILICVPSEYLLDQFSKSINNLFGVNPLKNYSEGNDIDFIIKSLKTNQLNIVISTYHSISKLINNLNKNRLNFDIKIADECHHLVSIKSDKNINQFNKFFDIPSEYTLFMTATEKNFESNSDEVFTMSNESQFGCIIDKKSIKWAIENEKITDYNIVCIQNPIEYVNSLIKKLDLKLLIKQSNIKKNIKDDYNINEKELFMAAFCALKMISEGKSNHLLIYTNKCYSSNIIELIIEKLLEKKIFKINNLYNKSLTSETFKNDNNTDFIKEIYKFKNSKYGIISCVYIFGEGFDLPKLDSVIIAEKMSTEIRIVQSCLRPNRLDKNNKNKIGKIIIPMNSNQIDERIKIIIKNMSNEDDMIEQKIKYLSLNKCKESCKNDLNHEYEVKFNTNKSLLNELIFDLYKSGSFGKEITLEKEYQLYKEIIIKKEFKSINEYLNSNVKYKNPNVYFYDVWEDWYKFLGIKTTNWINNKNEWINYCKENNINNAKKYFDFIIKNKDKKLPPEPNYYYPNFNGITNELMNNLKNYDDNYLFNSI